MEQLIGRWSQTKLYASVSVNEKMLWYTDKIRGCVGISGLEENGYNPAPNCKE